MKASSLKYRFCASVDAVRYNTFNIRGARGLEVMVQTHIGIGLPFLELYAEDNVLLTTSTIEETSNPGDIGGVENKEGTDFDTDPIQEPSADESGIVLLFLPELVPTEPEDGGSDGEGLGKDVKEDPQFRAHSSPAYIHNVDLSTENVLEFAKLSHKQPGYESSSLDSGDFKVGKEFSSKDGFVATMK
ncbi:hypothetical protein PVK06_039426 [Gossypium arboreum]|uniref:Uncharacterized protein n=1 Tax=Gossypium arboreum TaxID=29729 RepID=A0ABR0N505_GOSAR|nr:hypothetical protein PVK06_039426 [Gossypium arboreum]